MPETPPKNHHVSNALRKAGALLTIAAVGSTPTVTYPGPTGKFKNAGITMPEATSGPTTAKSSSPEQQEHHKPKSHRPTKHHKTHPTAPVSVPKPPPPETGQPSNLQNLHPENLSKALTPEVVNIMETNGAFIPNLDNCSGWILRNQTGAPVGLLTAKHCGLLPADGNLTTDKDGQQAFDFGAPIIAYTGNTPGNDNVPGNMQAVGEVASFYVDPLNTNDLAVGVFNGQDPQAVLAIAQNQLMPASQSSGLPEGTVVFERGMPQYQPNNSGPEEMQNFAMSILGPASWTVTDAVSNTTTTTEQLNVEVAAVPLSPDGSECSPGNSGSVSFTLGPNNVPQLIGVASAYNDWGRLYTSNNPTQAQTNLNYYQTRYNANLSSYSAVCAFSQELPTASTGAQFIPVHSY